MNMNMNKQQVMKSKARFSISKVVSLALFSLILLTATSCGESRIDKEIKAEVEDMQKGLPTELADGTYFDSINLSKDKVISYYYRIRNLDKSALSAEQLKMFKDNLDEQLPNLVKTSSSFSKIKEGKYTVSFYYADGEGVLLEKVTVTPAMYKK